MAKRAKKLTTALASLALVLFTNASAQEKQVTDLTGQDVSADQLVAALNIETRGVGAKCEPYQKKMSMLTRGISSMPRTASEVPDLEPVKAASVSATFEKNSAELTQESRTLLETIAKALKSQELSNQCFQLAGHTCDLGDDAYNMALSRRRADSVKTFLIAEGIEKDRLVTTGFGETSPMTSNESEALRKKNRRVELGALAPVALEYE
jgi:outer membrane protein OmpA-like peptidoglycan-associated protein